MGPPVLINETWYQSMMRSKKWSWLKAWAMQIARRRGMKKAIVAATREQVATAA